jgi:phospholipase/carboxylesterase
MTLLYSERRAAGPATGLLVLHHGRGTDEQDLLGLADALDPDRRLHVVTPRAALARPGWPGYHWYVVPRVGYPDPRTFDAAYQALAELYDSLWQSTGLSPQETVLGGFSMGAVMSYALGLGRGRPAVAGVLAFSGFIPTVSGFELSLGDRRHTRALIAHGSNDPVIDVSFARSARDLLQRDELEVEYHEGDGGHYIEPAHVAAAARWLSSALTSASRPSRAREP